MNRESMIKVLERKAKDIKLKIKPEFFLKVAKELRAGETHWVEMDGFNERCEKCGHFYPKSMVLQDFYFCPHCGKKVIY